MKYLVTGGTGFVGARLVRQLVSAGHQVAVLTRHPPRAETLAGLGARVHEGDITAKETLERPMWGVDGVFHLAAWNRLGVLGPGPDWPRKVNVEGTRNVLETMRNMQVPRGVYVSDLAVFSDSHGDEVDETYQRRASAFLSEYEHTKWSAYADVVHEMVREGLPVVTVMPGKVYGPGDPTWLGITLRKYLRGRLRAVPRGLGYSWVFVEDAAQGIALAMDKGAVGQSYILGGANVTLADALTLAERLTGRPAPRRLTSPRLMRAWAFAIETESAILPLPSFLVAEVLRATAGATYYGSSGKARRELGFESRPLEEGLRETLEVELLSLEHGICESAAGANEAGRLSD